VVLQHTTCGWTFNVELTQRRSLEKPNMLSFTYPFLRYLHPSSPTQHISSSLRLPKSSVLCLTNLIRQPHSASSPKTTQHTFTLLEQHPYSSLTPIKSTILLVYYNIGQGFKHDNTQNPSSIIYKRSK
jgi:hypothetical protein